MIILARLCGDKRKIVNIFYELLKNICEQSDAAIIETAERVVLSCSNFELVFWQEDHCINIGFNHVVATKEFIKHLLYSICKVLSYIFYCGEPQDY